VGFHELEISILGQGDFFGGQCVSSINSSKKRPKPEEADRAERTDSKLAMFDQPNHFQAVAIAETVEVLILTKDKYLSFLQTIKSTYSNQEFVRCMQVAVSQVMADRMKRADAKLLMFEQITVAVHPSRSSGSSLNTSSHKYPPDTTKQQVPMSEVMREPITKGCNPGASLRTHAALDAALDGFVSNNNATVVNEADCGYSGVNTRSSLASLFSQTGGRAGGCFVLMMSQPASGTSQHHTFSPVIPTDSCAASTGHSAGQLRVERGASM
jgi:hypothetical protein